MSKYRNSLSHAQNQITIKRAQLPAVIHRKMLPLFGRTSRKVPPTIAGFNEEWVVPSDQELYGKIRSSELIESKTSTIAQLKTVEEVSNESEIITSEISLAEEDGVGLVSDIGESFADETFSVVNDCESAVIEPEIIEDESAEVSTFATVDSIDQMKAVMDRLNDLERKFEELNMKVSKMETDSYNNNNSNPSIFVNEFINAMHEMMKTGMSYQQRIVGKFIEELDQMFDIDLQDFDPFK